MSAVAKGAKAPDPRTLTRVYLVKAEDVQEFYDRMREARDAGDKNDRDGERRTLLELVGHMDEAFSASKIVKVKKEVVR